MEFTIGPELGIKASIGDLSATGLRNTKKVSIFPGEALTSQVVGRQKYPDQNFHIVFYGALWRYLRSQNGQGSQPFPPLT